MSSLIAAAEAFRADAKAVTLDTLLGEEAMGLEEGYGRLMAAYEEECAAWTAEHKYQHCSKEELLHFASLGSVKVKKSDSKEGIKSAVLKAEWEKTDVFKAVDKARKAHSELDDWVEEVVELPDVLRAFVTGADELFRQHSEKATSIHALSHELRFHVLSLMSASVVAREASEALKRFEAGVSHAEVIRTLVAKCNASVRNFIPSNLSPTGHGVERAAELEGMKVLSDKLRYMLPRDQRYLFLTY